MFADDLKLRLEIKSPNDSQLLQQDLNALFSGTFQTLTAQPTDLPFSNIRRHGANAWNKMKISYRDSNDEVLYCYKERLEILKLKSLSYRRDCVYVIALYHI